MYIELQFYVTRYGISAAGMHISVTGTAH